MERAYNYRIEGALTPEQLADIEGLGEVTFTPVYLVFEREVNKWDVIKGLKSNDVDDVMPNRQTKEFLVNQGMEDGNDIEVMKELEFTGMTFEETAYEDGLKPGDPALGGKLALPTEYAATLAYRGVETYSLLAYYLVDLFISDTVQQVGGTEPETVVVVAEYTTDDMPPPITIPEETTPLAPGGLTTEEQAAIDDQTGNVIEDITEGNVPLGNVGVTGTWSLLSMIFAIAGLAIVIVHAIGMFAKLRREAARDEFGTESERALVIERRASLLRVLTIIVGAMTTVLWLYLDDLTLGATWVNTFTPLVGILLGGTVALAVVTKRQGRKSWNEEEVEEERSTVA